MFGFKKHFTSLLIRHGIIDVEQLEIISKDPFDIKTNNKIGRHNFFYNAFYLLSLNNIKGDYAEFGCFGGKTFSFAYQEAKRHNHPAYLWAFDSFEGLPKAQENKDIHPCWSEGIMKCTIDEFKNICKENKIPSKKYNIIPGFYNKTLQNESKELPNDISLAYIDCDLYSSTKDVLDFLVPRLKHGMIIAFDDYFMYSDKQLSGNRQAMLECFKNNQNFQLIKYLQFGTVGQSFIVEDMKIINQI